VASTAGLAAAGRAGVRTCRAVFTTRWSLVGPPPGPRRAASGHRASKVFVYLPPHDGFRPAPGSGLIQEATGRFVPSGWARVAELIGQAVAQGLATAVTTTTLGQAVAVSVSRHHRKTWRRPTSADALAGVDPAFRAPDDALRAGRRLLPTSMWRGEAEFRSIVPGQEQPGGHATNTRRWVRVAAIPRHACERVDGVNRWTKSWRSAACGTLR